MKMRKESKDIKNRRKFLSISALCCFFYLSAGIAGSLSAYKGNNEQKKANSHKLYVLVSGDPKHGGEKPCSLCKAAIEVEVKKMRECREAKWQGNVLEIELVDKKFSKKILKRIREMGFKAEILTTR